VLTVAVRREAPQEKLKEIFIVTPVSAETSEPALETVTASDFFEPFLFGIVVQARQLLRRSCQQ
jgi:hypothetical protein